MMSQNKTGNGACPKCRGFVHQEGQVGICPPNLHCYICGHREWFGHPDTSSIQRNLEPEPIGSGHGVPKRSHKKIMKDLKRELQGVRA
jgi:hypothetical protein